MQMWHQLSLKMQSTYPRRDLLAHCMSVMVHKDHYVSLQLSSLNQNPTPWKYLPGLIQEIQPVCEIQIGFHLLELVIKSTLLTSQLFGLNGPRRKVSTSERPFEFSPTCEQAEDTGETRGLWSQSWVLAPALLLVIMGLTCPSSNSLSLSFLICKTQR